jgi:hypothetical protein
MDAGMQSTKAHWEDWYEVVDEARSLRQGDILREFSVFIFRNEVVDLNVDGETNLPGEILPPQDWIILTASCDLDARNATHALLAPIFPATPEVLRTGPTTKEFRRRVEVLRKGLLPRQFLLAKHPDLGFPLSFASWRDLALLPTAHIRSRLSARRLRLRHPFREEFGNWVGSRMSAVGPEDRSKIPAERERIFDVHVLEAVEALDGGWDD